MLNSRLSIFMTEMLYRESYSNDEDICYQLLYRAYLINVTFALADCLIKLLPPTINISSNINKVKENAILSAIFPEVKRCARQMLLSLLPSDIISNKIAIGASAAMPIVLGCILNDALQHGGFSRKNLHYGFIFLDYITREMIKTSISSEFIVRWLGKLAKSLVRSTLEGNLDIMTIVKEVKDSWASTLPKIIIDETFSHAFGIPINKVSGDSVYGQIYAGLYFFYSPLLQYIKGFVCAWLEFYMGRDAVIVGVAILVENYLLNQSVAPQVAFAV